MEGGNGNMLYRADRKDLAILTELALELWPAHTPEELEGELSGLLESKQAAFFIAAEREAPVGFAQCQLRRDYVEGTRSSPVGYLEGIYVRPAYRGRGWAKRLLQACERWASRVGCREFASDCELDNLASQAFHQHTGFTEAGCIVCFTKDLL